jgi:cytochrome P450
MDEKYVAISTSGNLVAGGLSPGKAFDCLCRFLLIYPEVQDRIYAELQEAQFSPPISYDQAKSLPYLDGTIREAYRFNTSALANLQRLTGAANLQLPNGVQIPPRTNIGCSVSMVNHDSRIFGDDCDTFRPERWMQGKDEIYEDYIERKKLMERNDLTFGHGSRSCIGKNVAALEFFKAVATLMSQYKVSTYPPANKWNGLTAK